MQFCPTAFRIVYALNGLSDRKHFPGKIDILHLQCTKLPNAYTREKRKENPCRSTVHCQIESLNQFAFLIVRESRNMVQ